MRERLKDSECRALSISTSCEIRLMKRLGRKLSGHAYMIAGS